MFHEDGTFNFHSEVMALAEEFCREWVGLQGSFESDLEAALVLNFALCTIKHDLDELLDQLEWQPVFQDVSPRALYEQGGFGHEPPEELSDRDVIRLVEKSLRRIRRN